MPTYLQVNCCYLKSRLMEIRYQINVLLHLFWKSMLCNRLHISGIQRTNMYNFYSKFLPCLLCYIVSMHFATLSPPNLFEVHFHTRWSIKLSYYRLTYCSTDETLPGLLWAQLNEWCLAKEESKHVSHDIIDDYHHDR